MARSLRSDLVPRSLAQWLALLGLVPFAIGAWMQARDQREIRIATLAVDQRLEQLERRVDELSARAGTAGVQVEVTGTPAAGSDSLPATRTGGYDSLADGLRAIRAEAATLAREADQLTRMREDLRARRGALRGASTANVLLAAGTLLTLAGVLTDLRQFRQQRRRAAARPA